MKKGKGDKNRKSPSRERYDNNNPVVSLRVLNKDRRRFLEIRKRSATSHGDIYRIGLGIAESKIRDLDQIIQQAHDEGFEEGIEASEDLYAVSCPCSKCGKKKTVTDDDEKEAIRRFMMANQWHHYDCDDPYS